MELRGYPGKVEPNKLSEDAQFAEKLRQAPEQLTGVKFDFNKKLKAAGNM